MPKCAYTLMHWEFKTINIEYWHKTLKVYNKKIDFIDCVFS